MSEAKPWLAHYPPEIADSIAYDEKPLHHFLLDRGKRYKEMKAVHFMGKEFSFGNILSQAKKMASFLQEKGLEKGDRVASMLPNCPQAVITYYGALMAGGVVVQVNPLFKERELTY